MQILQLLFLWIADCSTCNIYTRNKLENITLFFSSVSNHFQNPAVPDNFSMQCDSPVSSRIYRYIERCNNLNRLAPFFEILVGSGLY